MRSDLAHALPPSSVHAHSHLVRVLVDVSHPILDRSSSPGVRRLAARIALVAQRVAGLLHVVAGRPELPPLQLRPVRAPSRRRRRVPALAEARADDALEREPEVLGEERVDQRIDGAVAVAQPEEHGEEERGDALLAERADEVHGEEGQPAEDEAADDDPQRFGRFGFHPEPLHLERGAWHSY